MEFVPRFLKAGKRIIDLSADYRLKDVRSYELFYSCPHKDKENVSLAVYGLPEFYRRKIKGSSLVANPGCYPTAAILGLAPLLKEGLPEESHTIIIDAKSGLSGAGRKANLGLTFVEANENLWAYKVNSHQHIPEIQQEVSILARKKLNVVFVPQVVPMERGILTTLYVRLKKHISENSLFSIYEKYYRNEPFLRVLPKSKFPCTRDVSRSNFCDIGLAMDMKARLAIIASAIDNLGKGASSQAIQNMNIMYGLKETCGIL
jgi:N-acetyl-gamma-glutamyl-phosphate reductase